MQNQKYFLKDYVQHDLFFMGGFVLYGLVVGLLIIVNQKLGVITAILPVFAWFVVIDKRNCLYLLLIFAPFQFSPFIAQNFLGIPGAKPFSLLAMFILVVSFYHGGQLFFQKGTTQRKVMIYLGIYFAFFSWAAFRSLNYLQLLHVFAPQHFENSAIRYMFSFYVKPSLHLVSFVFILNHITAEKDIKRISAFLCIVLGIISMVIIIISLANGTILMQNRAATNQFWNAYLGLHYNAIGSFYIILGPLVIIPAIKKRFWGVCNWCLALVAVALLQSRSSFLLFLFGNVLMLYFLGKKKELIILLSIFFLFSLYYLPGFLLNTLGTGLESGNWDEIFSGRIDNIWIPLLSEWFNNPKFLLIGKGLFSMVSSSAYLWGTIIQTHTAHNAFIEFFLDNGIILLFVLIFFMVKLLNLAWHNIRRINSDIGWAFFISIICYLIGTISGQNIYPSNNNMFLFPIIALLINYTRLKKPILGGVVGKPANNGK